MRKNRYHINPMHVTGRKFPAIGLVTVWLLIDRFKAPEWLYGIYWFIVVVVVFAQIYDMSQFEEHSVDIQDLLKREAAKNKEL